MDVGTSGADHAVDVRERLPAVLAADARLTVDRLGHFSFHWAVPIDVRGDNQAPDADKHGTISLDPGVRTFMTGYDTDGGVLERGAGDVARVSRLCVAYDHLQSRWSQPGVRHRRRYRLQRAGRRIMAKVHDLVHDLHRRLARWLCSHYRAIVLPVFESQQMAMRVHRRIRGKTARAMLTWSHYAFRQRLLATAREHPWCRVLLTTEEYTTATCGRCGNLNLRVGSAKVFRCPRCGFVADRDANAARNILLKLLTSLSALLGAVL